MKFFKTAVPLSLSLALLLGCQLQLSPGGSSLEDTVKIASFNTSFDRKWLGNLIDEMQLSHAKQQTLVDAYVLDKNNMSSSNREKAENIIKIRNVAAIIQINRPQVLLLKKFNSNGSSYEARALKGFEKNYLGVSQYKDSIDATEKLEPISYPYTKIYATNSGENSALDLDNNGVAGEMPGDAWGHGNFHGQNAFLLMSKHKIDTFNTRTFQGFKWKDMPGAHNPTIIHCNDPNRPIPRGMRCGDKWYTPSEWNRVRLSSQNHVDVPVKIETSTGEKTVHLLLSHPTSPTNHSSVTDNDKLRNRDEIRFWSDYINNKSYIYDDNGKTGGLGLNKAFVIMGDLNLDPNNGDGYRDAINDLLLNARMNGNASVGSDVPTSSAGAKAFPLRTQPECTTSDVTGTRSSYVTPSSILEVNESTVYWPLEGEDGSNLIEDDRIGDSKSGHNSSSDHRMVTSEIKL